jgi:hypothetical protein
MNGWRLKGHQPIFLEQGTISQFDVILHPVSLQPALPQSHTPLG